MDRPRFPSPFLPIFVLALALLFPCPFPLQSPGVRLLSGTAWAETTSKIVDIESRPGVSQRFLLLLPEKPFASVILLAGGDGNLDISPEGNFGWGASNFLVRSRGLFAKAGFVVAVMDISSAFKTAETRRGFRGSEGHARDIAAVGQYLRKIQGPVWVVGTSRGTISAANAAIRLGQGDLDGIVLTSSVTRGKFSLSDLPADRIRIPTLLIHNSWDQCDECPFSDAKALKDRLANAPKVEFVEISGGDTPKSKPCDALSYHGFLGKEEKVVEAIARWIQASAGK